MESIEKPLNLEDYKSFLEDITGKDLTILTDYYSKTTATMKKEFCESTLFNDLFQELKSLNDRFQLSSCHRSS